MRFRRIAMVLGILFIISLAGCDLVTPGQQQTATPAASSGNGTATSAPTAATQPTAAQPANQNAIVAPTAAAQPTVAEEELQVVDLAASDKITSYRETVNMLATEGVTITLKWSIMTEWVKEPPAKHMLFDSVGDDGQPWQWETIQIGDASYMRMGDEWIVSTGAQEPPTNNDMLYWANPDSWRDNTNCSYKGKETVNGMETKRWHCDKGVFVAGQANIMGLTTVDEGVIDSWVSTEFEVVVKSVTEWKGKNADAKDVSFHMDNEVKDINQPIEIKPPQGVDLPGLPEDIPMMEGATEVMAIGDMATFKIAKPMAEVTDFYDAGMKSNGWTKGEDMGLPGMMQFTKDTRTAQIIIAEEGAGASVMINVSKE